MASKKQKPNGNGATLGFESVLWAAADKLRGHMDAAEYKHVVLGLIFLKYISDAFDARHELLAADPDADPEDRDEYVSAQVFWVPLEARWGTLRDAAKSPEIGVKVDAAMDAIERDNPRLKGVLPKDYARPTLDKVRLGELIDLIGTIAMHQGGDRSRDVLGRVYEYFLGQFASKELFGSRPEGWIRLRMKSGVWIGGAFTNDRTANIRSYAAGYPYDQDLYLAVAADVNPSSGEFLFGEDGRPVTKGTSIWVRWEEVEYLEFAEQT